MAYCVNDILELLLVVFVQIEAEFPEEVYESVVQIDGSARISNQVRKRGLLNRLFQAVTPGLFVHTRVSSVAALHTTWGLAGAFDFCGGIRAVD